MTVERLIHEIRRRRPALAKRADGGSKLACIQLFCIECYGGGVSEAQNCDSVDCPLWGAAGTRWTRLRRRNAEKPPVRGASPGRKGGLK